jgi:demethylmenaquinone methyltransferase/2-methoxy-6-polyprenyl-1,4-benzoquinol methylase
VKSGGKVVILEFTSVQSRFFQPIFHFYISKVLPFVGEIISGKQGAYKYLPDSMLDFPAPEPFTKAMEETGLQDVRYHKLTFGASVVYVGTVK